MQDKKIHDPESPWYGFEVISTYTDSQAVDDGVLVSLSPTNRVTRAVWEWFVESAKVKGDNESHTEDLRQSVARERSRDFIGLYGQKARQVYEQNTDGGIFKFTFEHRTLWIIPNELDGLTLMFPEDY